MIDIIEVGPRDGLQNVKEVLPTGQKKALIQFLLDAGFKNCEAGAFVRADKVPAMADSADIATHFKKDSNRLWYLTPNQKGLEQALDSGCRQLAFFTAPSEVFNEKNIGMSVEKGLLNIKSCIEYLKDKNYTLVTDWNRDLVPSPLVGDPIKRGQQAGGQGEGQKIKLRLYISTVIASPFEGAVSPKATVKIMEELLPLGFAQVSLGDTIGVGVPKNWKVLLKEINKLDKKLIPTSKIAMHCHDTYGTALANVAEGLNQEVQAFDSSIGGLGGCPYAPGATGNLATEDLVYFLEKEGLKTEVKLDNLLKAFDPSRTGSLCNNSKVAKAIGRI